MTILIIIVVAIMAVMILVAVYDGKGNIHSMKVHRRSNEIHEKT